MACKELILQNGINNLTVAQVAKTAGIGKGTVYEYFTSKDEIVFELVNILMQRHSEKLQEKLQIKSTTKEKIKEFASFFYSNDDRELRVLYKEFIALSLIAPQSDMVSFHKECNENYFQWFYEILVNGVETKELKPEALLLAKGLFLVGDGMFLHHSIFTKEEGIENDLNSFIDTLFDLMEKK